MTFSRTIDITTNREQGESLHCCLAICISLWQQIAFVGTRGWTALAQLQFLESRKTLFY